MTVYPLPDRGKALKELEWKKRKGLAAGLFPPNKTEVPERLMDKEPLQVILSKGAFFEGELRFKGTARVAGELQGQIRGSGSLIVEATAKVSADIELDHFILLGEFKGKVKARKSVLMEPPAKFTGEVFSPSLIIKEGVFFEGSSKKTDA